MDKLQNKMADLKIDEEKKEPNPRERDRSRSPAPHRRARDRSRSPVRVKNHERRAHFYALMERRMDVISACRHLSPDPPHAFATHRAQQRDQRLRESKEQAFERVMSSNNSEEREADLAWMERSCAQTDELNRKRKEGLAALRALLEQRKQ
jgi:hypothetical protein